MVKSRCDGFWRVCCSRSPAARRRKRARTGAAPADADRLILVEGARSGIRARPVDPATLDDLAGFAPVSLGHHYIHAVSPDGATLAAIVWPTDRSRNGKLRLIDLQSWTEQPTEIAGIDRWMPFFVYGDTALYWADPATIDRTHDMPRGYVVKRYDLAARMVEDVAALPNSFMPGEARLLRDGSRLAIYGVPTDANHLAEDAAHVLFVDLEQKRVSVDLRLDGVRDWQRQIEQPGRQTRYEADHNGLAWDTVRDLLYVAHAGEDRLTVVDLAAAVVARQSEVRHRQSGWDRLRELFVSTARAKMVPGTMRYAALGGDGQRLFVWGMRSELSGTWPDAITWREIPLGVQVIDTRTAQEVGRVDLPVDRALLSPDGSKLLLAGRRLEQLPNQLSDLEHSGAYVFDAQQLRTLAHFAPDDRTVEGFAFSPDGRYAYISHWSDAQSEPNTVEVFDVAGRRVVAERSFGRGFVPQLIALGR